MKINKTIIASLTVWILSTSVWVYTFALLFTPTESSFIRDNLGLFILFRLALMVTGLISFFTVIITLIKNRHFGEGTFRCMQIISIISGITCLFFYYIYDQRQRSFLYSAASLFGDPITLSAVICLVTLLIGTVIAAQREEQSLIQVVNLIVATPILVCVLLLLFLIGIGFGPPS